MSNKEFFYGIAQKWNEISLIKNCFDNLSLIVEDFINFSTDEKYDSIIAYSCYSSFNYTEAFFKKAYSLLENGGIIAIAHIENKEKVNETYNSVKGKIETTFEIMNKFGFKTIRYQDDNEYYICIGEKV
jgi:demethylmenaquinone methyltransferase/2-methoxy-6-polyprenyl-1,4-benzoquinol methylase